MEFNMPYGDGTVSVRVDDDRVLEVIRPSSFEKRGLNELLEEGLQNPSGTSFQEFLKGKDTVLLILNDLTRPTPTAPFLDALLPKLEGKELKFVVATGSHKPPEKPALRKIMGRENYELHRDSVVGHESRDDECLRYAGDTARATSVYYNKIIWEADGIVNINSVEPHYFAGYTGGRKSFLPGVAGYKTITKNHSLALEEGSQLCRLDGNPVNEDMEGAASMVEADVFSFNLVLDEDSDVAAVYAGDLRGSFRSACDFASTKYTYPLKEKADVVLAAVHEPMNQDLYQTQKVIESAKYALKKDGILVFVSSCENGVGPENYYALMSSSADPKTILMSIKQKYKLGYHKAARLLDISLWASMYGVTELDDSVLERVFMKPYPNAQEAVDAALEEKGPDAKLIYMENSILSVPVGGCAR